MQRDRQHGFSLVEVVVALGILAGLLISIAGLFVLGTRQVDSGRHATEALAVATGIVEETEGWGFRQLYELFEIPPSWNRAELDTRSDPRASSWQPAIGASLHEGYARIVIEAVGSGLPTFADARAIRVTVVVHWREGSRPRSVRLATVRF
ncbi:MAG: prepilin-type N-terminal cleavage/methylation domain-containing protein [Acidobacteriota bacterium]|nr:prepilin-type N-terminal cleavage/methylation domain-containing protein [Acidobacteriota bacterium]